MNQSVSICTSPWISLPSFYFIPRFVIIFIGLFSNTLLLIGMIMDPLKCFNNSSSYLIINVSISDILTGCAWILVQYWQPCIGGTSFHLVVLLPPYVASTSIVTMAFDRYMSCVYPFRYRILITRNVTLTVVLVQWLFSGAHLTSETLYEDDKWQFYSKCSIAMVVLIGATIMYGKAAYVWKKNSKYFKTACRISSPPNNAQLVRFMNETQLLTTMSCVSCITITTVSPASIYVAVAGKSYVVNEHLVDTNQTIDTFYVWLATLLFVNYSVNPFMYTWRLKNYRATFKILFKKLTFYGEN